MSLDIPVFDLQNLRRAFYNFFAWNLIVAVPGVIFRGSLHFLRSSGIIDRNVTWILLFVLLIASVMVGRWSKKEIARIVSISDLQKQFEQYEKLFKRRLLWNALSVFTTSGFLLLSNTKAFLVVLIIQIVLTPAMYPRKSIITRELRNTEIVFI